MKSNLVIALLLICSIATAQQKQMWAKSYLNEKAPAFVVEKWLSDQPDMDGKFILIDFWATWCGPCKKAIPELNEFHKKFADQLVVIGLSDEQASRVKRLKRPAMQYYSAIDTKRRMYNAYQVRAIPHCVIINPEGIVVWEGYPFLNGNELTEEVIANLLQDNAER